jgi:hypothetical protein
VLDFAAPIRSLRTEWSQSENCLERPTFLPRAFSQSRNCLSGDWPIRLADRNVRGCAAKKPLAVDGDGMQIQDRTK